MTTSSEFKGDYGTPEQTIPAQGLGKDVSWESCMTINDTWGFRAADTHWKSSETLIRNLIDIASKGGNYLLNVGPNGQGEIPAASIDRLAAIGAWMKINGESIHGTTASMFSHYAWDGCSTTRHSKDGSVKIYLQIFKRPEGGKLVVENLMTRPKDVMVLGQSAKLNITGKEGMWNLQLPASGGDSPATVVVLSFDREPVVK
jgi:alpha-L-fucosidase